MRDFFHDCCSPGDVILWNQSGDDWPATQHLKGNAALTFGTTGPTAATSLRSSKALTAVLCEIRCVVTQKNALVSILPGRAPQNEAESPKGLRKFLMSRSSRWFPGRAKHQLSFDVQILPFSTMFS